MFCLKQVCVHWVNLMNKQIISKAWNFEPNGCNGKYSFVYINLLVCLYLLSSKFLARSICHMCTCKPKYWCTIMYACEKSLAPHDLSYLGLFKFFHSIFFHVIVIFKSGPKKCWSFYFFFWNSNCEWTFHKK